MLNTHTHTQIWALVVGGMAFLCVQQCSVVTCVCEHQALPQMSKAPHNKLISILSELIILQSHKQTV